jgi:hypothetical protein
MKTTFQASTAFVFIAGLMPAVCGSEDVVLKEMPKAGDIPYGKIVYVDDGKCPKGEIKQVTGGSEVKKAPRKVRCVKAPDKPSK